MASDSPLPQAIDQCTTFFHPAPAVQRAEKSIQRITRYPVDYEFQMNTLSAG